MLTTNHTADFELQEPARFRFASRRGAGKALQERFHKKERKGENHLCHSPVSVQITKNRPKHAVYCAGCKMKRDTVAHSRCAWRWGFIQEMRLRGRNIAQRQTGRNARYISRNKGGIISEPRELSVIPLRLIPAFVDKVGSRPPGDWCGTPHSNNGHVSGVPVGYRRPTARRSVAYLSFFDIRGSLSGRPLRCAPGLHL